MDLNGAEGLALELLWDGVDAFDPIHHTTVLLGQGLVLAVDVSQRKSDAIDLGLHDHDRTARQLQVPLVKRFTEVLPQSQHHHAIADEKRVIGIELTQLAELLSMSWQAQRWTSYRRTK